MNSSGVIPVTEFENLTQVFLATVVAIEERSITE